jgi:hypothetical protein
MTPKTNIIELRPKKNQVDSPMLLDLFLTRVQHYLINILEVQYSLGEVYLLFDGERDIWEDQCADIIMLIKQASHFVHDFCQLVDINTRPPKAVVPLRYPLVVTLHHMSKQLSDLMQLTIQFRGICRASTTQTAKQRQVIEDKLRELIQSCDDLNQRVHTLYSQTNQINV